MPTISKDDPNYIYVYIGKQIKKYRTLKNLSQSKLARKCNFTDTFISNLENNSFQTISIISLYHIAKALEIPTKKLLEGLEEDIKE